MSYYLVKIFDLYSNYHYQLGLEVLEVLVVQEILDQVEDLEISILAQAVIKGPLELFFHQVLFNHLVLFNNQVLISQLK